MSVYYFMLVIFALIAIRASCWFQASLQPCVSLIVPTGVVFFYGQRFISRLLTYLCILWILNFRLNFVKRYAFVASLLLSREQMHSLQSFIGFSFAHLLMKFWGHLLFPLLMVTIPLQLWPRTGSWWVQPTWAPSAPDITWSVSWMMTPKRKRPTCRELSWITSTSRWPTWTPCGIHIARVTAIRINRLFSSRQPKGNRLLRGGNESANLFFLFQV